MARGFFSSAPAPNCTPLLLLLMLACSSLVTVRCMHIRVIQSCRNPLENPVLDPSDPGDPRSSEMGIIVRATTQEFYESFARVFRLSDGSSIRVADNRHHASLRYMQDLLYTVGVYVHGAHPPPHNQSSHDATLLNQTTGINRPQPPQADDYDVEDDGPFHTLQICGQDMVTLMLLGTVGNFVTGPTDSAYGRVEDPNLSPQSSLKALPTVVIDAYTGQLTMHLPYDAVRGYFVEALLIISIIVISRLTFVRSNTYTTVVYSSLSDPGSGGGNGASATDRSKAD